MGRSAAVTRRDEHWRQRPMDLGRPGRDRDQWSALEATFVAKLLRKSPNTELPRT